MDSNKTEWSVAIEIVESSVEIEVREGFDVNDGSFTRVPFALAPSLNVVRDEDIAILPRTKYIRFYG